MFCFEGWMKLREKSLHISTLRSQEPYPEALPTTVIPHSSSRAATPFDNTWSAVFDFELTNLLLPSSVLQTQATGTQSETQQTNEVASGLPDVRGCENDLVPVPTHEPFHNPSQSLSAASYDTRSLLASSSPQYLGPVYGVTSQFVSDPGLGHSVQYADETAGPPLESLQNIQSHQVEPTTPTNKRRRVAFDIAIDASPADHSTANSEELSPLCSGIAFEAGLSGWPELPTDVSVRFLRHTKSPVDSIGSTPLPYFPSDDYATPPRPQLSPVYYDQLETPASAVNSPNLLESYPNGEMTKDAPGHYLCCGSIGSQRFACPFYKYDPMKHWGCMSKSFNSIGHMRQHLDLSHKLGPNSCKSCWQTFDTADSLVHHTTTQSCRPRGGVPVDYLDTFPRMRRPKDWKWYWGWKQLFGDEVALPCCPFFHPGEDLTARHRP
jgi:hypothetical protein